MTLRPFMTLRPLVALIAFGAALSASAPATAQPAPSFRAECGALRTEIARLKSARGAAFASDLITISVDAVLTKAEMRGPLAFMTACGAPAPQVICVTYQLGDWKAGDRVLLSGTLDLRGDDIVVLDPCLHAKP